MVTSNSLPCVDWRLTASFVVVMISVVDAQREILLDPQGTNVWSGGIAQSLNSGAVTWSLAKDLYGRSGPYFIIPLSLIVGMVPTFLQWLISKVRHVHNMMMILFIIYL